MKPISVICLPITIAGRSKVKRYPPRAGQMGFTLVEILIAIFIFSIVITSVYASYRATFHIVQGSEARLVTANKARVVMERLAEDLGSIVTGPGGEFHGVRHKYADSLGDDLSFVSSAHLALSKTDTFAGDTLVKYQSELDDTTGLLNLYRSEVALLPGVLEDEEKGQRILICQGLREVRFSYLDSEGNDSDEWEVAKVVLPGADQETEASPFPALVLVQLKFSETVASVESTLFKTAVALPRQRKN